MAIHMIKATFTMVGMTPVSFSKRLLPPNDKKKPNETNSEHDARVYREKMHYDAETGEVFLDPMMLKKGLDATASLMREKVEGKGNSEFGKLFLTGVAVEKPIRLGVKKDDVPSETIMCRSDGKRLPGGSQVPRTFPVIEGWKGDAEVLIYDPNITKEKFLEYLEICGVRNGIGRFRPQNGGFKGRFRVDNFKWSAVDG